MSTDPGARPQVRGPCRGRHHAAGRRSYRTGRRRRDRRASPAEGGDAIEARARAVRPPDRCVCASAWNGSHRAGATTRDGDLRLPGRRGRVAEGHLARVRRRARLDATPTTTPPRSGTTRATRADDALGGAPLPPET